jgi:hypothetical protein
MSCPRVFRSEVAMREHLLLHSVPEQLPRKKLIPELCSLKEVIEDPQHRARLTTDKLKFCTNDRLAVLAKSYVNLVEKLPLGKTAAQFDALCTACGVSRSTLKAFVESS